MRIVRSLEDRARLAVAAGFQLGARPAALSPSQRDLFSALTHRAFAGVLEQSAQAGCQAFVCGQGLFAESPPSLDNVRAAMAPLGSARRVGMTVVATGEPPGPTVEGTDFLAEVGLVDTVLRAQASAPVVVPVANLQIGLVTSGTPANGDTVDVVIEIRVDAGDTTEPAPPAESADIIISTQATSAPSGHLADVPVIAAGCAGPSLERYTEPGFVILDFDPATGVIPSFVPTEVLRPARLVIDSPRSGGEVANLIVPELGTAGFLDVEMRGRVSRATWHEMDPQGLIERAVSTGTLLRFAIDQLEVDDSPNNAAVPARSSFLVNARRVSEQLLAAAPDNDHREIVTAARARVVEIARSPEPTKAVS